MLVKHMREKMASYGLGLCIGRPFGFLINLFTVSNELVIWWYDLLFNLLEDKHLLLYFLVVVRVDFDSEVLS